MTANAENPGYTFLDEERPLLPGAPYSPPHPTHRRIFYLGISVWIAATGSLSNAAVLANLGNLTGQSFLTPLEAGWLPAVYVAFNASANLLLVKSREQFGVARVMRPILMIYLALAILQVLLPLYSTEIVVRAVSGLAAAGQTSLAQNYLIQSLPRSMRQVSIVISLGIAQLATPFARMLPVDFLCAGGGHGLHLIELLIVATTLTLTQILPLPPGIRAKVFRLRDFATLVTFLPAMILLCGVLSCGRIVWWTDAPWIGISLAVAVALFGLALLNETTRHTPLLQLGWLGSSVILSFAGTAFLMRLALAEQTYGSVGLLTASGLNDDQMRGLFACVALAVILGIVVAAATMSPKNNGRQVIAAALAIGVGAWLDSHANSLTRPDQLYLSQMLLGFGASLFMGPALSYGVAQMMKRGPTYFISLIVLFSLTQNVGGLAGSALLGSYQTIAARYHASILGERMVYGDPQVIGRISNSEVASRSSVTDSSLRGARSRAALGAAISHEANTLALNDVFRFVAVLAFGSALFVSLNHLLAKFKRNKEPAV